MRGGLEDARERDRGAAPARGADRADGEPEPALEWSFNPWRERPLSSGVALLLCIAMLVLLLQLGTAPAVAVVLGLALAGSLGALLIPAHCRVDDQGIAYRRVLGWERRRWRDIGRAHAVRGGLLVSPFQHARRLDAFRALLLPVPRGHRRALIAALEERLARHGL